ncbi:alpha/beta hydrolase family protein [Paenibacillus terrigena]|uniref:alpha/beta hydrolase family protein n=1 Tax=Paenibacillus terrigena TaxID=369333 RepID=UPI000379687D|nr:CocE/NonD family hydrolase [Paenibacillus terrigena]
MLKRVVYILLAIVGCCFLAIGVCIYQNNYQMIEKKVTINTSAGVLTGTLVTPKDFEGKLGLVVFVHGDGPQNDSYDGGYRPLWEKLAMSGYASLSWNKPGINGSSGNWLHQSMEDRKQEVIEAIAWARQFPEIDASKIGLWGASQAGWVIPKVLRDDRGIAFSILVAPAINWISQGRYNTSAVMKAEGYSDHEIAAREQQSDKILALLDRHAPYEDYLAVVDTEDPLSRDRWGFVQKNYQSDATNDLKYNQRPLLLILGGQDQNVDVNNTREVYMQVIDPKWLSIRYYPNTGHSMIKESIASSTVLTNLTAVFFPRQLMVDGYLEDITTFLQSVNPKSP